MAKMEWINRAEGNKIATGDKSQLRIAIVETADGKITGVCAIRKWAKYATAQDKNAGLTKESVPFRPTTDSVSFPISIVPEVINELQALLNCAVEEGIIHFDDRHLTRRHY